MWRTLPLLIALAIDVPAQIGVHNDVSQGQWQTGNLLGANASRLYGGSRDSKQQGYLLGGRSPGSARTLRCAVAERDPFFVVETKTNVYTLVQPLQAESALLKNPQSEPAVLTFDSPVRFRFIDARTAVVEDETAMQRGMILVRQTRKEQDGRQQPPDPDIPEEITRHSGLYLEKRLDVWTLGDAEAVLGKHLRRWDFLAEDGTAVRLFYVFSDPTQLYREFELGFSRDTRLLASLRIVPWRMTWEDCKALWGDDASTNAFPNGHEVHSYRDRRLDVVADGEGKVLKIGIY